MRNEHDANLALEASIKETTKAAIGSTFAMPSKHTYRQSKSIRKGSVMAYLCGAGLGLMLALPLALDVVLRG